MRGNRDRRWTRGVEAVPVAQACECVCHNAIQLSLPPPTVVLGALNTLAVLKGLRGLPIVVLRDAAAHTAGFRPSLTPALYASRLPACASVGLLRTRRYSS